MEMVVFCGLQGSGKSTYYAANYADTHVRLNLDMLRNAKRESILMHACIAAEQPFVIDRTNPKAESRARYAAIAKASGFKAVLVHFDVPVETCVARNAEREGKARVPDAAIYGTANKFEPPSSDEGWDEIIVVV